METYLSTCFTFTAIFHGSNDAGSAIGELQFRNGAKRNGLHWPLYTGMEMAASKSASVAVGTRRQRRRLWHRVSYSWRVALTARKPEGRKGDAKLVARLSPITHRVSPTAPFSLSQRLRLAVAVPAHRYSDTVLTSHLPKQPVVKFAGRPPTTIQLDAISRLGWVGALSAWLQRQPSLMP